jgi:hypothetical protein
MHYCLQHKIMDPASAKKHFRTGTAILCTLIIINILHTVSLLRCNSQRCSAMLDIYRPRYQHRTVEMCTRHSREWHLATRRIPQNGWICSQPPRMNGILWVTAISVNGSIIHQVVLWLWTFEAAKFIEHIESQQSPKPFVYLLAPCLKKAFNLFHISNVRIKLVTWDIVLNPWRGPI